MPYILMHTYQCIQLTLVLFITPIRSVLVFFNSLNELNNFRSWIPESDHWKTKALVFTEETPIEKRADKVEEAVKSGQVTFLTKELGRGTDFSSEGNFLVFC